MEQKITLVLFCKRPLPAQGKQRLAATMGAAQALRVAEHLLACALEDLEHWPGPVVISPASAEDADWASLLGPADATVVPQAPGDLGDRIHAVDRQLRRQGHERILFMGSDAPALTPKHFEQARKGLAEAAIVLARADDGGVTLMGANRPWPNLSALPWSTRLLCGELHKHCRAEGMSVLSFDGRYDIDRETDLMRFADEYADDPRPTRRALLNYWESRHGC
ncbi:MAG: DUF2064 domain-containing protein [Gammaproteobacteria bacterium]|nr:DUF2064 domain-containing protein [Gammaproteobacteria bacterium]